jgi:EmrB/QacA subfamily drug resistance transporter
MADNDRLKWLILLTVIVGTFLGRLDQTVVSLAVPKIMLDFNITTSEAGWIATAYILANAVFVPVWGKLGDTIGRKKVYVWGFLIFIVGSILAGFSWDLSSMIVFRIIQAIASSADYPTAMAIISVTFRDGRQRAQALGLWSAAFAASAVFGPLIGGPLIDNFGWRSVFLVNLPVGLIGLAMALAFIPESVSDRKSVSFDWWGAITLGIALSLLVFGLDRSYDWGWTSLPIMLCYALSGVFLYLFYLIDSRHPEPMVDFKYLKIPAFVWTLVNNFVVFMGMIGGIFLIPIFDQIFLGYNATETGLQFIPMAFCMVLAAPLGASLVGKVQPRYVIAVSTFVAGIGMYLFTGLDARSGPFDILIPISVMAFGMGFAMAQRTGIIAAIVPHDEIGSASAVLALVRNIAGAFGIAVFATLLNDAIENNMIAISAHTVVNVHTPAVMHLVAGLMYLDAQILAYRTVFFVSAIFLFAAAFLALLIDVKETPEGEEVILES